MQPWIWCYLGQMQRGSASLGDSGELTCGQSVNRKHPRWQLTGISQPQRTPRARTETGIFRIMSIIYASCLPSGYNQKPTRASSHTQNVISVRHEIAHCSVLDKQPASLASGQHLSNLCVVYHLAALCVCLIKCWLFFLLQPHLWDLKGHFQSRQRWSALKRWLLQLQAIKIHRLKILQ